MRITVPLSHQNVQDAAPDIDADTVRAVRRWLPSALRGDVQSCARIIGRLRAEHHPVYTLIRWGIGPGAITDITKAAKGHRATKAASIARTNLARHPKAQRTIERQLRKALQGAEPAKRVAALMIAQALGGAKLPMWVLCAFGIGEGTVADICTLANIATVRAETTLFADAAELTNEPKRNRRAGQRDADIMRQISEQLSSGAF